VCACVVAAVGCDPTRHHFFLFCFFCFAVSLPDAFSCSLFGTAVCARHHRCILATDLAKGNDNIAEFTRKVLLPAQAAGALSQLSDQPMTGFHVSPHAQTGPLDAGDGGGAAATSFGGSAGSHDDLVGCQVPSALSLVDTLPALDPDAAVVLMQMVLKCADVSHPARPMAIHLRWSNMVRVGCVERT